MEGEGHTYEVPLYSKKVSRPNYNFTRINCLTSFIRVMEFQDYYFHYMPSTSEISEKFWP